VSVTCPGCRTSLQIPAASAAPTGAVLAPAAPPVAAPAARADGASAVPSAVPFNPANQGWMYTSQGKRWGPIPWPQLQQLAAAGQLQPADQVWTEGMGKPVEARTLSDLFPATPPPVDFSEMDPSVPTPKEVAERLAQRQRDLPPPLWQRAAAEAREV